MIEGKTKKQIHKQKTQREKKNTFVGCGLRILCKWKEFLLCPQQKFFLDLWQDLFLDLHKTSYG
jgi:hypothetical protein